MGRKLTIAPYRNPSRHEIYLVRTRKLSTYSLLHLRAGQLRFLCCAEIRSLGARGCTRHPYVVTFKTITTEGRQRRIA